MRLRKRLWYLPLISIASLTSLLYLVIFYPPNFAFNVGGFSVIIFPLVLLSLMVFLWSAIYFATLNKYQGLLVSVLLGVFLILRLNKLNQPFFLIMLLITFGVFEFLLLRKK